MYNFKKGGIMEPKKPWQSKTILVASILGLVSALSPFVPALEPVRVWIEQNGVLISSLWGVLAIALRAISKDAIQLKD